MDKTQQEKVTKHLLLPWRI